jgi:acetyltransferase-like isoleucine patch superfamily enzyme
MSIDILNTPWKIQNEALRWLVLPYIRLRFALSGVTWGMRWRILGMPILQKHRGSMIELGEGLILRSWPSTNPLAPNHPVVLATRTSNAVIRVGNNCGFTGTTLVAAECIQIGNNVQVGANSTITDTDFHPIDPARRLNDFMDGDHQPVCVQDNVFIGMNSIVLKGVTIGANSVIGAGSVVINDIPPGVVAAGNPARVIRTI